MSKKILIALLGTSLFAIVEAQAQTTKVTLLDTRDPKWIKLFPITSVSISGEHRNWNPKNFRQIYTMLEEENMYYKQIDIGEFPPVYDNFTYGAILGPISVRFTRFSPYTVSCKFDLPGSPTQRNFVYHNTPPLPQQIVLRVNRDVGGTEYCNISLL